MWLGGGGGTMQDLVSAGADLAATAADPQGATPLVRAAQAGHVAVVEWMLQRGAAVDAATREGQTALMLAAFRAHMGTMNALVQGGAAVDAQDTFGRTALMLVAESYGHGVVLHTLLDAGAQVRSVRHVVCLFV